MSPESNRSSTGYQSHPPYAVGWAPVSTAAVRQARSAEGSVLDAGGPLYASQGAELRRTVRALLRRGERTVVLCLGRVTDIDAAGIGELVRAYNLTVAAAGAFRVVRVPGRVREILDRVGLLHTLTARS